MRLSKMAKWGIYGLTAVSVGVVASALAIREYRYPDDWRLCSDIGAYHFDYRNAQMIFDDYILADQGFEMQKCADDISLRHCSRSVLNFVNPLRVSPEAVEVSFSVYRTNGQVIATIPRDNSDARFGITTVTFDEDGSFLSLAFEYEGVPRTFKECEFPLFR